MNHQFDASNEFSFSVVTFYGEGVVCPSNTQIYSQKVDCSIDCGNFVPSCSSDYPSMRHSNKYRFSSSFSRWVDDNFSTDGDDIGGVGTTIKLISAQTSMMGCFVHLSVIAQQPLWNHLELGIIQLVLVIFPHLVFLLVILEVVFVLVTRTFTQVDKPR